MLDTAAAYGQSEAVLGRYMNETGRKFPIVSKFSARYSEGAVLPVCAQVQQSLQRLQIGQLHGYLVHRFEDVVTDKDLWTDLRRLRDDGLVERVGFSVYLPEQVHRLLDQGVDFDIVQIPYSLFDRRFRDLLGPLNHAGVEVHVRSVFLQGLMFLDPASLSGTLVKARSAVQALRALGAAHDVPVAALALNYPLLDSRIDRVVLGVDSLEQLRRNLDLLSYADCVADLTADLEGLSIADEEVLLPYKWVTS
jgi:aryl-alcohol dehydrogenase-like predicted oxidoreductase